MLAETTERHLLRSLHTAFACGRVATKTEKKPGLCKSLTGH